MSLYFFKNRKDTGFIYLFIYLLYGLLSDLFLNPLIKHFTKSPFVGFRIFTIVEYTLIAAFLSYIINNKKYKKAILYLSIAFLFYCIFDFFNSNFTSFDSSPTGISCILILTYSIFFLFEKINYPDSFFLYSTANFWIVVALIIFFAGTFFIYIFSQSNFSDPSFNSIYNLINSTFTILRNLLFAIAFLIKPDKSKQSYIIK